MRIAKGAELRHQVVTTRCSGHRCRKQRDRRSTDCREKLTALLRARDLLKAAPGGRRFFRSPEVQTNTRDSLHSSSFTRRATRAVVGADCEKADGVYLKRLPPAQAPCPRANPGLHLATLQASGRLALAPRRSGVTRASVVRE